jgi:hypothetical protein
VNKTSALSDHRDLCIFKLNFTTLLVVFYASIKNSVTAFYAKFMTLFDVFYSNPGATSVGATHHEAMLASQP